MKNSQKRCFVITIKTWRWNKYKKYYRACLKYFHLEQIFSHIWKLNHSLCFRFAKSSKRFVKRKYEHNLVQLAILRYRLITSTINKSLFVRKYCFGKELKSYYQIYLSSKHSKVFLILFSSFSTIFVSSSSLKHLNLYRIQVSSY